MVLGDINLGSEFDDISLNRSLNKLYDTNFFKDIELSLKNNSLTIDVIENPIIEKINITGIKKKSLTEIIYDAIYLKDRMSYTEFQFNKDVNLIKNILKTNGYYFSKIKLSKEENNEFNSIILNIDINLGKS